MEYYSCLCHTLCVVPADCALRRPHWNTIRWTLNDGYIFSPEWEFKIIFKGQRNLQGLAWAPAWHHCSRLRSDGVRFIHLPGNLPSPYLLCKSPGLPAPQTFPALFLSIALNAVGHTKYFTRLFVCYLAMRVGMFSLFVRFHCFISQHLEQWLAERRHH